MVLLLPGYCGSNKNVIATAYQDISETVQHLCTDTDAQYIINEAR